MTLKQDQFNKPEPKEEAAMSNLQSQIKNLRNIISNMKQEFQRKDPVAWGIRQCPYVAELDMMPTIADQLEPA